MSIMKTRLILALSSLLIMPLAQASDSQATTASEWNPASLREQLQAMPTGNAASGQTLHQTMMCASCHGNAGIAPSQNWPNLAGQKADYTYKVLLDYQSGLRDEDHRSELMTTLVKDMNHQQMADLAVYYADLETSDTQSSKTEAVPTLISQGDPKRLITPCASCHGLDGQGGINASPALAGQQRNAFIRTMQLYKNGARHNDVNETMRFIAKQLSDDEIENLADYYQSL